MIHFAHRDGGGGGIYHNYVTSALEDIVWGVNFSVEHGVVSASQERIQKQGLSGAEGARALPHAVPNELLKIKLSCKRELILPAI